MANPYDQFDANPYDQFDAPPAAPERTTGQELDRQVGLALRVVPETLAAIPLAAADFGVGLRNLVTGSRYESPSVMFKQGMDAIFPKRETPLEEGVGIVGNIVAGSKIPVPSGLKQGSPVAPQGFKTARELAAGVTAGNVRAAQDAGYVIPPATSNPTATNKTLEGIAGKLTTAQAASAKNQATTMRLASRALGLPEDVPLTPEAIQAVRAEAGKAYEAVRGAGTVQMDDQLAAALNAAEAATKGANRSFPGLASTPAEERIAALRQPQFDAGDAVDAIRILRDYASTAGAQGEKFAAKTYQAVAKALEDSLDRHLAASGNAGAVKAFREARQLIAKTYTVEKAFNQATGQVSATKLAGELSKGKPMTGELRQAAEFGQAFPKAARNFNESLPGISPLDFYAAGGTAALSREPYALLYPFLRQGVRNALMTPLGQRLAVPSVGGPVRPEVAAALAQGASQTARIR